MNKAIFTFGLVLLLSGCVQKPAVSVDINGANSNGTSAACGTTSCPTSTPTLPQPTPSKQPSPTEQPKQPLPQPAIAPIAEFRSRITKKPFGIYITPQNSPVQPERFTGYHTGTDVEYTDVTTDVPVVAVADGVVQFSGRASGYGGVVSISHTINGKKYLAIYGHLNPASLIANGTKVTQGQKIGILGKGYSSETDGERKHLHFGLYIGSGLTLKGYVQTKAELKDWVDPLTVIP